jgi:thiol-disulfide isomerase/thioredoxin
VGDILSVKYYANVNTVLLKNARNITCEVLVLRDNKEPFLIETPLKRTGKVWNSNFKLDEPHAQFMLFRFRSGVFIDDNNGKSWEKFIYGSDDKVVQGAHYFRGITLMRDDYLGFKRIKDLDILKTELNIERKLYPEYFNWVYLWSIQLRSNPKDSTLRAEIKSEFETIWQKNRKNEVAVNKLFYMFDVLGMTEKGDSIRQQVIAANPKGKIAENYWMSNVFKEKDSLKRAEMAEKYFTDFSGDEYKQNVGILFGCYLGAGLYDKALSFLEHQHIMDGNYYNTLAYTLMMHGKNMKEATALSKRGVDLLRRPAISTKPSYMSKAEWKEITLNNLGIALDTYAWGLFNTKRQKEAEVAFNEAVKDTKGKMGHINAQLLECYIKNGKYKLAMKTAAKFVQGDKANDEALEQYKTAYVKLLGFDKGFNKLVEKSKAISEKKGNRKLLEEKRKILKQLLDKPEVNFTLKDLNGNTLTLSDLKGKVVVVDFWATWCDPCIESFPALQKIYSKYKDNSNVAILAINTWEKKTGKESEDLVKTFILNNKYAFRVLYDEGFVDKYKVDGIPTKFRFRTVGFDGEQETITKTSAEIDLLLSDAFYNK